MPKPTPDQIIVASVVMLEAFRFEHARRGIDSPVRHFRDYPVDQQQVVMRVAQKMLHATSPEKLPQMLERVLSSQGDLG